MSGSLMFLRYAYPCAESQLAKKLIDPKEYALLKRWAIQSKVPPMIEILEKAFPEAVFRLSELAKETNRHIWSLENVLDFWRNHHNYKDGNCNVRLCRVKKIEGLVVTMTDNSITSNIYNVNVIVGRSVFVHKNIIIEVI